MQSIPKKFDRAIVIMRFMAIVMIVLHHSFTVFLDWPQSDISGMWMPYISVITSDFLKFYGLALFTFISGFLVAHSHKEAITWDYVLHKIKRILIPCAIAACIFLIFFKKFMGENSDPVNGTPLWYLPMIFLLYFLAPVVNTKNVSKFIAGLLIFTAVCYILWFTTNITTFKNCLKYAGYFVSGALFFRLTEKIKHVKWQNAVMITVGLLLSQVWFYPIGDYKGLGEAGMYFDGQINNELHAVLAIIICCLLYYILNDFLLKLQQAPALLKGTVKLISAKSFFIYLTHQFAIDIVIILMPRNLPCFRIIMITTCFIMALAMPLCLDFLYYKLKSVIRH